jgi:hypothetical protein
VKHRAQLIKGSPEPARLRAVQAIEDQKLNIMASTKKWSTELKDTGYITKEDLQTKLKEIFESEGYGTEDFKIAVRFQLFFIALASTQFY